MKKLLFLTVICLSSGFAHAQVLATSGTISSPGNSTLGYYKTDGTIEDSHHATVGYIKKDGTIEDSHHSTIGYLKSDGTLEDSHHSTIGHAVGNKMQEAAIRQFFFNHN